MSATIGDPKPAQHPAEILLHSSRGDYAATSADRERVRRALAQRLAQGADVSASESSIAPSTTASLSPLVKVGLALVFATTSTLTVLRYSDTPTSATISVAKPSQARSTAARAVGENPSFDASELGPRSAAPPTPEASNSAQVASTADESHPLASDVRTTRKPSRLASNARATIQTTGKREAANRRAAKADNGGSHELPSTLSGSFPLVHPSEGSASQTTSGSAPKERRTGTWTESVAAHTDEAPIAPQKRGSAEAGISAAQSRQQIARRTRAPWPAAAQEDAPQPAAEREVQARETDPLDKTVKPNPELVFLKRIQSALQAHDPQAVLELSRQHERRWPHGIFAQERDGLRTIAACQTHAPDGMSRATKFSAAYPRSPMLSRVRATCMQLSAAKPAH